MRSRIDWDEVATVLDLGGTPLTWVRSGLTDRRLDVLCVNIIGEPRDETFGAVTVHMRRGDATDKALVEGTRYDLVFSNSVIEHVGDWAAIERFAEVVRTGRQYFVQTPYRFFPVEPHFILPLHFLLPRPVKTAIVMVWDRTPRRRSWAAAQRRVDSIHLLTCREMRTLFPDADIVYERRFGVIKSILAFGGAAARS